MSSRARLFACTAVVVSVAGLVLAVPSTAGAKQVPAPAAKAGNHKPTPPKPKPVPPRVAPGTVLGGTLPAKPHRQHAAPAAGEWSVSLSADTTVQWPTRYVTLTATTNMDVGPTPYYIRIYNFATDTVLGSCASGTSCSVPFTTEIPVLTMLMAKVTDAASNVVALSSLFNVDFGSLVHDLHLRVAAEPSTLGVGATAVVAATTETDVGPSPFTTQIYDATTHTLLGQCYSGTSCTVWVSQSTATTHMYQASIAVDVLTFPGGQEAGHEMEGSSFIYATWADSGWTVSLSASPFSGGTQTFTATANRDVGPTPYYIEIFSIHIGKLIAICGSGSSCTVTDTSTIQDRDVEAFVTTYTPTVFPLPDGVSVQASSNVVNELTD